MERNLIQSSVSSLSSLVALQLFSKLFTFGLNQAWFRLVSPRAFGTAAIQFELVLSTILFLSREGVRHALLRTWPRSNGPGGSDPRSTAIKNVAHIPLMIGLPLSVATTYIYGYFAGQDTRSQPYFSVAIGIYALAAMAELFSEPMHNKAMCEFNTAVRVRAEGIGITSKSVATFLVMLYDARGQTETGSLALLAFAFGQLAYALALAIVYLVHYGRVSILPKRVKPSSTQGKEPSLTIMSPAYFDTNTLHLSITMTWQSIVKHFLTEGDKLILSWLSPLQDQGGYALAVNYGSLVARVILQPVEETFRVFFSKLLSGSASPARKQTTSQHEALQQAANTLLSLLTIQISLSLILLVFGTTYMPLALYILLPPQYLSTSAPQVLSAWIWYIPVLAINGGLEAFFSSAAVASEFQKQSRWMVVFSIVYVLFAISFYSANMGDAALVYANMINLSARIIYALNFTSGFFNSRDAAALLRWKDAVPSKAMALVSFVSFVLVRWSEKVLGIQAAIKAGGRATLFTAPILSHVAVGGLLGLVNLYVWWRQCGRLIALPQRVKQS